PCLQDPTTTDFNTVPRFHSVISKVSRSVFQIESGGWCATASSSSNIARSSPRHRETEPLLTRTRRQRSTTARSADGQQSNLLAPLRALWDKPLSKRTPV